MLVVSAACSESDPVEEGSGRDAAVIEQVIRELAGEPDESDESDDVPVVYVVGVDGTIGIEVQASVAAALVDHIDVRFVDERVEAIDETVDGRPVRDDGVLLVIQDVPVEGEEIEVQVDRYVAFEDEERMVVSLEYDDPEWDVTSSVELEHPDDD
ncbi:MAG: hypothetical protein WD225_07145 [Ilumatobacteraceae bacterium]